MRALIAGCSSASSGHAPGVAGGQNLTPGITNYPLAYVKRPVPAKDIDVRDLITSTAGGDLYVRNQANAAGAEVNVTQNITINGATKDDANHITRKFKQAAREAVLDIFQEAGHQGGSTK